MRYRFQHACLLIAVLAASSLAVLAAGCGGDAAPAASPAADAVVATVNDRDVRESAVAAVRAESRLGGTQGSRASAVREAIDRELIRQEAERLGVVADAAIVRRRLADLAEANGGEAAMAKVLGDARVTREQLRQILTDAVLREALLEAKYADVGVGEGAVRAYYEGHPEAFQEAAAVKLGAISVAAERIAENALERVREGQPFDQVSRQFTSDPELKANNGDMGWVLRSSLPKPLQKVVDDLDRGEVSEPAPFLGRWYVFELRDRREARTIPYGEVRARLDEELTRRKRGRALAEWLRQARESAAVTRP